MNDSVLKTNPWTYKVKDSNGKHKAIWTKIGQLKNIELYALPVYDARCIKAKIRTYGGKVCTNFRGLNVPEDDIEYESFTLISIDSFLVYGNKYY